MVSQPVMCENVQWQHCWAIGRTNEQTKHSLYFFFHHSSQCIGRQNVLCRLRVCVQSFDLSQVPSNQHGCEICVSKIKCVIFY